ncbi:MAG: AAA family ATPase [Crenarchaeota archaeon]|nr:AAA family ATPase [Thermoproteota archaeon]
MPLLTLEIENFGPVVKGRIPLNKLTILIGPNSSGKTYTTELTYVLIKALERVKKTYTPLLSEEIERKLSDLAELVKNKLIEYIHNPQEKEASIELQQHLRRIIEEVVNQEFSRNFIRILRDVYRTEIGKLVTADCEKSSIRLYNSNIRINVVISKNDNDVKINVNILELPSDIKIEIRSTRQNIVKLSCEYVYKGERSQIGTYININDINIIDKIVDLFVFELYRSIMRELIAGLVRTFGSVIFIPAPRRLSTLTEYGRILKELVRECYANITKIRNIVLGVMPEAPLHFEEFVMYSILVRARHEISRLYNVVKDIEKVILCGSIFIKEGVEIFKDFRFNAEVEPHLASASVQQLSEIIMLLKYLPNISTRIKTLIIEEPELHCHPQTQTFIALFLALLANSGLNVIVTTHSDYLIQRVYSLALLGKLKDKDSQKYERVVNELCNIWLNHLEHCNVTFEDLYNIIRLATLSPESLSLISFRWSKEHRGFIAEPYSFQSRKIPTMSEILDMLLSEDIVILEEEKESDDNYE